MRHYTGGRKSTGAAGTRITITAGAVDYDLPCHGRRAAVDVQP